MPCLACIEALGRNVGAAIERTGDRQNWIGEQGRILRFDKGHWKELSTSWFYEKPLMPDFGVDVPSIFAQAAEAAAGKWILVKPNESGVAE